MIYPAPAGVDPQDYQCGECGSRFTMPWTTYDPDGTGRQTYQQYALRCVANPDHETYVEKNNGRTKMLVGPNGQKIEVDVLTQKATTGGEIVLIKDEATALAVVKRQNNLAMFPDSKDITEAQMVALAHVAFHYQMDIIMGEIMPYQGKPFITIKGRRRHDKREGHRMGITFRMPREDEVKFWTDAGVHHKGDLVQIAIGTEPDGLVTEAIGRVLASELDGMTPKAKTTLPIGIRQVEMAQKRAESRLREMVFGAIGKPQGLNPDIQILGEGDDSNVVEGTARVIPDNEPEAKTMPDFGDCPEHGVAWVVDADKFTGSPRATHHITGKEWCYLDKLYKTMFESAWASKFGEPDNKDINTWMKERFGGQTMSKLSHMEWVQAYDLLRVDESTGDITPPSDDEPDQEEAPSGQVPMPDENQDAIEAAAAGGEGPNF